MTLAISVFAVRASSLVAVSDWLPALLARLVVEEVRSIGTLKVNFLSGVFWTGVLLTGVAGGVEAGELCELAALPATDIEAGAKPWLILAAVAWRAVKGLGILKEPKRGRARHPRVGKRSKEAPDRARQEAESGGGRSTAHLAIASGQPQSGSKLRPSEMPSGSLTMQALMRPGGLRSEAGCP